MILVVGYGNPLRRDDGAGPRVAEAVAARRLPGVEVVVVQTLVPELAERIAAADRVIFVDAAAAAPAVAALRLDAGDASPLLHAPDPRGLLALTAALAGQAPEAWIVTVPARDLGVGEGVSAETAVDVEEAIARVVALAAPAAGA